MRNRSRLRRIGELRLCRADRLVGQCLVAGMRLREIARATGFTLREIRIRTIVIEHRLGRLPPDDMAGEGVPVEPQPAPLNPGAEITAAL